jgi:ankyrin repeat protein
MKKIFYFFLVMVTAIYAMEDREGTLHAAIKKNDEALVEKLIQSGVSLEKPDKRKWSPLYYALVMNRSSVAKLLIKLGANPRSENGIYHWLPLHCAAGKGNAEIVTLLLQLGADINSKSGWPSCTPLHNAVRYNQHAMVKLLVSLGADINSKDDAGCTPLHNAVTYYFPKVYKSSPSADMTEYEEDLAMIKLLIALGADVHSKAQRGTPYDYAVERELRGYLHENVAQFLLAVALQNSVNKIS